MTRKTFITLSVLLTLGTSSAAALAQSQAGAGVADANRDGFIDRAEAAAMPRLATRFDALDLNRDGRISKQERPARSDGGNCPHRRGGAYTWMKRLDSDGDRRISRAEAAAGKPGSGERFAKMDVNRDGFVDGADRQQRARQKTGEWFTRADIDRNGSLSRAEFEAARDQRSQARGQGNQGTLKR